MRDSSAGVNVKRTKPARVPLDYDDVAQPLRAGWRAIDRFGPAGVAALCMHYHLTDPEDTIAESHRMLRPGGSLRASSAQPSR
jgi:hypothetical protein